MTKIKKPIKESVRIKSSPFKDYWNRNNYILLVLGTLTVFLGFYLMGQGTWDNPVSLSISPIVLLVAYLIIIPMAIFFNNFRKSDKKTNVSSED